ncbi:glucose transmembrane transporter [Desmophyllum pertusum]|uniref:Glucose transmembrane transporter n=1 Tax=Desmophyllum pertusum TaxID=174260 RepID=A0A9X0CW24_9CNID|nr:glucose transmembrane transporter [Desmophyllum pertusum]
MTVFNETMSRVPSPRHYHTKSFVQYAYWLVAYYRCLYSQVYFTSSTDSDTSGVGHLRFSRKSGHSCRFAAGNGEETENEDLPQVFKPAADHSSIRLSFCSLPAKIPLVTMLAGLFAIPVDGLQGAYGGYLYTYAVKSEMHMFPQAMLPTLTHYSGVYSLLDGLFQSLFLYFCYRTKCCSLICNLLHIISAPILPRVMDCTGAFGLFMSSVFPSTLSMAEHYIDVTGSITSILIVSSATGEMVIPVLVGKAFAREGPLSFLVIGFLVLHDLYRAAVKRLCRCNQASDDCEYTPLVTCDEETEETGHELIRGETAHRVVELQS